MKSRLVHDIRHVDTHRTHIRHPGLDPGPIGGWIVKPSLIAIITTGWTRRWSDQWVPGQARDDGNGVPGGLKRAGFPEKKGGIAAALS
jgi:hypothetical protein